jgi:hypothetical protein
MQETLWQKEVKKLVPADINLEYELSSTFGKREVEDAAVHLVRYLQEINAEKWNFKFAGLLDYYKRNDLNADEMLFGLFGSWFDDGGMMGFKEDPGYIVNWGNGLQVTQDFLKRLQSHVIR